MSSSTRPGGCRGTRQALAVAAGLLAASQAAAGGLTVTVPGDYATIQEAVDAVQSDASPGEVVVESDGVFEETVVINESVTLRAGALFSPTIEQVGASVGPLRLFGDPDGETEVLVEGLTLRLIDSDSAAAVSIRNVSDSDRLEVRLEEVVIEVENAGFGVRAESGNGGTVDLVIIESTIEIVGGGFGVIAEVSDQGVIDLVHGHNLLFDNAAGDYGGIAMPGPGDLFADPVFVAPAEGDYRLVASSPAVDAGDNEPAPAGGVGLFDVTLGPRILDGDLDGVAIVDIGAYGRTTEPLEVPALSTSALLAFAGVLAAAAAWRLRRRPA